jgi:hypothetical protein
MALTAPQAEKTFLMSSSVMKYDKFFTTIVTHPFGFSPGVGSSGAADTDTLDSFAILMRILAPPISICFFFAA